MEALLQLSRTGDRGVTGRGGKFKWFPHSEAHLEKTARHGIGLFNLTAGTRRGEIAIGPGMRMLVTVPLAPYTSGTIFAALRKRFTFQPIPPLEAGALASGLLRDGLGEVIRVVATGDEKAGVRLPCTEWTALKEYDHNETFLPLVIELKQPASAAEVSSVVDEKLKTIDMDYIDVHRCLAGNPVRTTVLSRFKPGHVNPPQEVVDRLLALGTVADREL